MKKKWQPVLIACVLLATAAGAWWWQLAGDRLAVVMACLPATPDLTAAPQELRTRTVAAESRARSRATAAKGLAELGRLYHANGFLAEAMRCYAGLEQLAPGEPRWPHLHASILAGYGETEPALKLWRRVVELAPDYLPARLRLGDGLLKTNHPDEAAATYAEVLKRNPADSYALLGLARIDLEARRWDQARERLEKVVAQTNYELGYDLIVSLYERTGQPDRARAIRGSAKASGAYRDPPDPWLDELMDICFDPYRLALTAGIAARFGQPAVAVRLLERAVGLAPDDVSCRFQLGGLAVAQRNFPVAREQFERCTTLAPDFSDGWGQLSALQLQMGESAAAARTLAAGLARCPGSPGLHLMQARNQRDAGRIGEAIGEYQESIRLRPNEPEAYTELGNLYINLGRTPEGVEQMRRALEADPGDPTALGVLTFYSISTGDEAEARRWFARLRLQPRVPPPQTASLAEAYRQAFGRPFVPDRPEN